MTPAGYDYVEEQIRSQSSSKPQQKNKLKIDDPGKLIRRFGTKKFKRYIFIWLFAFGVIVAIYKFNAPRSFQSDNTDIEMLISDEKLNDIFQKAQEIQDTIQNKN